MLAAGDSQYHSSNETVKILLKHGANVNLQDNDGYTALMRATEYSKTNSSQKTVKLLSTTMLMLIYRLWFNSTYVCN